MPAPRARAFARKVVWGWKYDRSAFFASLQAGDAFRQAVRVAEASAAGEILAPLYFSSRRQGLGPDRAFAAARRR